MNTFEVFKIFQSIRSYYRNGYDYPKYGCIKTKIESFLDRPDRHKFEKYSKKYSENDFKLLCSILFFEDSNYWIFDLDKEEVIDKYYKHKKFLDSSDYFFEEDCNKIIELNLDKKTLFLGSKPKIVDLYLKGKINVETIIIFDLFTNFLDKQSKPDIIQEDLYVRIKKYKSILNLEKKQSYLKTIKKLFLNTRNSELSETNI